MDKYGMVQQWYKSLPHNDKLVIRDIFIEILKENDCHIKEINNLSVDWGFNITHKEVQKILKSTRKDIPENITLDDLTDKEKHKIKKRESVIGSRLQSKALTRGIRTMGVGVG